MGKIFNNNSKNIQKLVHNQFKVITKGKISNKLQKSYSKISPNRISKQRTVMFEFHTLHQKRHAAKFTLYILKCYLLCWVYS